MKVPTGTGKYYKRAQARTAGRGSVEALCLTCEPEAGDGARRVTRAAAEPPLRWSTVKPTTKHDNLIARAALDSGVDQALLTAVIAIESGFRSDARSPKGALGLMQLMPATAAPLLSVDDVERARRICVRAFALEPAYRRGREEPLRPALLHPQHR